VGEDDGLDPFVGYLVKSLGAGVIKVYLAARKREGCFDVITEQADLQNTTREYLT
jgi:hypothetical protein